ncbi:MAG: PTS sugar transporter subunit IIA [Phycisphaeraceae bacterium]|nr:PTS sugar transporter subunit IIA [Phycisphaeraceae bacterium]
MRLEPYLDPDAAMILEKPGDKGAVLAELAQAASRVLGVGAPGLLAALEAREAQMPTSTPEGVALPHALTPDLTRTLVIPVVLRPGVRFGGANHPPADLVFGMFGPSDKPWDHLRVLARIARLMRTAGPRDTLRAAPTPQALHDALLAEDRAHE